MALLIKKDNCAFAISEVQHLVHLIDQTGIRPRPEKVKAIHVIRSPESLSELRTLSGVAQFYHKYIRNFASVSVCAQ